MNLNEANITNEGDLPIVIKLPELDSDGFVAFFLKNRTEIEKKLLKIGAIKFQGIQIEAVEKFQRIVNSISSKFLSYIDGNSPRTKLTDTVYTSTEYDNTQKITMHNELSYSAKWPNKLFFSCLQLAQTGGETLIADSREILNKMDKDIVFEIQRRGVTYIRNLHSNMGMGPSWKDTFETNDKKKVEKYCKLYSIDYEWGKNDALRLKQQSKGIIEHRESKEKVWFNQIDQFHPSHLGEEIYDALIVIYDSPEEFPMYVKFGDGKMISEDIVREILRTIDEITVAPPWQKNELLIIDNELVSHGRNSFTGDRKVFVAMSE